MSEPLKEMTDVSAEALEIFDRLRGDPTDDALWDQAENLAEREQCHEHVSVLYREILEGTLPADRASSLGQRAVGFHEGWAGEDSELLPVLLERVIAHDPKAEWAFQRLTVAYTVAERWDELLSTYDRAIEAVDDTARRMELLDEAAHVAKDFASNPDRAIDYLSKLFELDPSNGSLAASLERLLERQSRYAELVALWKARIEVMSTKQARDTRLRMAEFLFDKLQDAPAALAEIKTVLEDTPANAQAYKLLEQILVAEEPAPEARRDALGLLKEHYLRKNKPKEVIRVLEASLAFEDGEQRKATLRELTDRLVDVGDDKGAMTHQCALMLLDPSAPTQERLRALAEKTGQFDAFADVFVQAADGIEDAAGQIPLLMEAARARHEILGDEETAIALYQRVFGAGADEEATLSAARCLDTLLQNKGRDPEWLEVLVPLSTLEPNAFARREALGQRARLAHRLGDDEQADEAWRARVADDPGDVEALDALVSSYQGKEMWRELAEVLHKRAQAPVPTDKQRADMVQIARIYEEQLGELQPAIETWRHIQSTFGEDSDTVSALGSLLSKAERWEELAEVLARAIETERANFTQLQVRLGDAYRERLARHDEAAPCYHRALQADPACERARTGMRALLDVPSCRSVAARALADAFAITDDWKDTLDILEARVEAADDDNARAQVLMQAAELYEHRASEPERALTCYSRAFAFVPHDRRIEQNIRRLAESLSDWQAVIAAYQETIRSQHPTSPRVAELRYEEGRTLEERIGDREAAARAYAAAFEREPKRTDFAEVVVRICCELGQWHRATETIMQSAAAREELETLLVEAAERVADANDAWDELAEAMMVSLQDVEGLRAATMRELQTRLASWHRDKRQDVDAAQMALQRAMEYDASNRETLGMLIEFRRRNPDRELVEMLLHMAELDKDDLDPLAEAAQVATEHVGEFDFTVSIVQRLYSAALQMWRRDDSARGQRQPEETVRWALDALVRLYSDAGAQERVVELLMQSATLPFERDTAQEMRHRAADIAYGELKDNKKAIELYREILQVNPADRRAIERLAQLYERMDRMPDLLTLREHELALDIGAERRVWLRLEIARILGVLEDRSGRVRSLIANLEEAPGHDDTIDALCDIMAAKGRHADLVQVLRKQAEHVASRGDSARAAQLWQRVAAICERDLRDADGAIDAHRRLFAIDPMCGAADDLARLFAERGDHTSSAEWLERRLATTQTELRPATYIRLARARIAAEQPEQARASLEQALNEAPASLEVRELLADLYRQAQAWEPLAELLTAGVEHVPEVSTRLEYLREAAELFVDKLQQPTAAVPCLRRAVELVPDDRELRLKLADCLHAAGERQEAKDVLTAMVEQYGRKRSPERAELHYRLAKIAADAGDAQEAFAQLETTTKMDLGHATALHMMGQVAREHGDLERAERAYRGLLMLARRQGELDSACPRPAEILYELCGIARQRGDQEQAEELLESAIETAIQSDVEARRFQDVLRARGETDMLMRVLDVRLSSAQDAATEAEILATRAEALSAMGRDNEAMDAWIGAIERDDDVDAYHDATRELAAKADQLQRYIDCVSSLADRASRKRGNRNKRHWAKLTLRLGHVIEREVGDVDRAAALYAKVESSGEFQKQAWLAMASVAGARGDAGEQRRVLQKIGKLTGDSESAEVAVEALYQLAELEIADERTRSDGLGTLEEALEHGPRYDRAKQLLEVAFQAEPDNPRAFALYGRVARESRDQSMLLNWLERCAERGEADFAQMREAVELAQSLGEIERAETLLGKASEMVHADGATPSQKGWVYQSLASCRELAGDRQGAIKWLRDAVEVAEDEEVVELTRRLAETADRPDGDYATAVDAYYKLFQRDPGDPIHWRPMLAACRNLGDRSRFDDLANEVLDALLDPGMRALVRMAQAQFIIDVDGSEADAVPVLQEVLSEDPENAEASQTLTAIYKKYDMVDELVELLSRQFDRARDQQDADTIAATALQIGALTETSRPDDALDFYRAALEWVPQHRPLLEAFLALLGQDADPRDRANALQGLLATETDETASRMTLELVDLWEQLHESEKAQEALELGLQRRPEDRDLVERLQSWYRDHEQWQPLVELLLLQAETFGDGDEALARLRRAAELCRSQLGDQQRSTDILRRALAMRPDDLTLLAELTRNMAAAGQHTQAIEDISNLIEQRPELDGVRAELLMVRSELLLQADDAAQAVTDMEEAYQISREAAAERLVASLHAFIEQLVRAEDFARERAARLRLVAVLKDNGDLERAREALAGLVQRDASDVEALRGLKAMDTIAERWEDVVSTCEQLVEHEQGELLRDTAMDLLHACTSSDQRVRAIEPLERVYRALDADASIRGELRKLYEETGASVPLAHILMDEGHTVEDAESQVAIWHRAAELFIEAGQAELALEPLRMAREAHAGDDSTTSLYVDALIGLGRTHDAAAVLEEAIASHKKKRSPGLAILQLRMARLCQATGDDAGHIRWLKQAMETDRSSGEIAAEVARVALERGDYDLAMKGLRTVIMSDDDCSMSKAHAFLYQAQIAFSRGDRRRAQHWARKAKSLDPGLDAAQQLLDDIG